MTKVIFDAPWASTVSNHNIWQKCLDAVASSQNRPRLSTLPNYKWNIMLKWLIMVIWGYQTSLLYQCQGRQHRFKQMVCLKLTLYQSVLIYISKPKTFERWPNAKVKISQWWLNSLKREILQQFLLFISLVCYLRCE